MATTKRGYVFAAFILSCGAFALLVTSLATQMWVVADVHPNYGSVQFVSSVNYGLFTGRYERQLVPSVKNVYSLTLTCLMSENVCAWSCLADADEREDEVEKLYAGIDTNVTCPEVDTIIVSPVASASTRALAYLAFLRATRDGEKEDVLTPNWQFVNAGLWLSTVIFLILALIVTTIATVLAVLNAASNPSRTCFALDGLYFWNGAAAGLDLLPLILWGSQFSATLVDNVVIRDVIQGIYTSSGGASLGYSYWLILVAMFASLGSLGVLALRDYLLSREPPPAVFNPDMAAKDGTIFLY